MDKEEIRDRFNELYEIALLYRRRLECPHTSRREYLMKELKEVEEDIEKLHVLWDNLEV
jgi:hypothetical protein